MIMRRGRHSHAFACLRSRKYKKAGSANDSPTKVFAATKNQGYRMPRRRDSLNTNGQNTRQEIEKSMSVAAAMGFPHASDKAPDEPGT